MGDQPIGSTNSQAEPAVLDDCVGTGVASPAKPGYEWLEEGSVDRWRLYNDNPHNLSWAAGFFQGHGHFALHHQRRKILSQKDITVTYKTATARVSASGQDARAQIEQFCATVGMGTVLGPYIQRGKERWQWHVSTHDAVSRILELFRPWLYPEAIRAASNALKNCNVGLIRPNNRQKEVAET